MSLRAFVFFSLIFLSSNTFSQETDLEEIVQGNPFNISEAAFKEKWVKKYKIDWRGGYFGGSKRFAKIYGFSAAEVNFRFSTSKLSEIKLRFKSNFNSQYSYKYWSKKNYEIYSQLLETYGKPKNIELRNDSSCVISWEKGGLNIVLVAKAINSDVPFATYCDLFFYQKTYSSVAQKEQHVLPKDLLKPLENKLKSEYIDKLPSEAEVAAIAKTLSKLQAPKILINNSHKVYYAHTNFVDRIDMDPLEAFQSGIFSYTFKKTERPDYSSYIKVIAKDSMIIGLQNIRQKDNKETICLRSSFIYDKNKALKVIHSSYKDKVTQLWIDYDSKGFLSRVLKFKNGRLSNLYFLHTDNQYEEYIALEYNYENKQFREYKFKVGEETLKNAYSAYSGYTSLFQRQEKKRSIHIQAKEFSDYNLTHVIPNVINKGEWLPKKAFDSSFLKPSLTTYKKMLEVSQEHNQALSARAKEIFTGKTNPFTELNVPLVIKVKDEASALPFVVNKVAKTAIQVKTLNGKLVTVFKNKIILKNLQLVNINDKGAEFKNLQTQKNFFMEIGQKHFLDKTTIVSYKGVSHKLKNDDNFMGYKVIIENKETAFSKGNKLYRINGFYYELPNLNELEGLHRVNKCGCYKDPANEQSSPLNPAQIRQAKTDNMDHKYFAKFCDYELYKIEIERRSPTSWSTFSQKLGLYNLYKGLINPIYISERDHGFELLYKGGSFTVNGKKISEQTDKSNNTAHVVEQKKDFYTGIKFLANNPWTLARMIKKYGVEIEKNGIEYYYNFGESKVRANREEIPFQYNLNPDKSEIVIDGEVFKITFKNARAFIQSDQYTKGFPLFKYLKFSPR